MVPIVLPAPTTAVPAMPAPSAPVLPRLPTRLTLPPISITGADFNVDMTAGGQLRRPPTSVKLVNVSLYVLEVTIGAQVDHLAPGEANVFRTRGQATLHVHPIAITTSAS